MRTLLGARPSMMTAPSRPHRSSPATSRTTGAVGVVEQVAAATVGVGGEREVQRRDRLALGDHRDEVVLAHGAQRVVRGPLLADGGLDGGGHVLAAGGAGAVGGVHPGGVGQGEELVVQRPVQAVGRAGRLVQPDRGEQVGPADVADEQRVAGQHRPRRASSGCSHTTIEIDSGVWPGVARISSVTAPERQELSVGQRLDGEVGLRAVAVGDDRAGRRGQLEVPGEEVGVEVGLDDPLDA